MRWRLKILLLVPVAIMAGLTMGCAPDRQLDGELARLLVGTWTMRIDSKEAVIASASFTYAASGQFTSEGTLAIIGPMVCEGKWSVVDGFLITEVTSSSHSEIIPVGDISKDRILKLDARVLETRNEDREIERYDRKPG
jgi:hypothetical protein